jgi:hypothetical protein
MLDPVSNKLELSAANKAGLVIQDQTVIVAKSVDTFVTNCAVVPK